MGWIRERILAEEHKHSKTLNWAHIAELKIVSEIKDRMCANPKCIRYPYPEDCIICSEVNKWFGSQTAEESSK